MRQITRMVAQAIIFNKSRRINNTVVSVTDNGYVNVRLHDNLIATVDPDDKVAFCMCGWPTPTTRERLQAVGVQIAQRKGEQYYIHPNTREEIKIDDNWVYQVLSNGDIEKAPNPPTEQ